MEALFYTFTDNELKCSGQDLLKLPQIDQLTSKITYMDLSYNKISSLDGLENYTSLETLILDSNLIVDLAEIPFSLSLTTLSLNKNKITDLDVLLNKLKTSVPALRYLSLLGNRACPHQLMGQEFDDGDYHRYRCYVIHCLANLKFLDSTPVTKEEREEAALRGHFLKTVKPAINNLAVFDQQDLKKFLPLPAARKNLVPHRGVYGACRYRYTGKNSEGNRFIRNNDL